MKVFYGDDRVAAQRAIKQVLGDSYEVIDGSEIKSRDLPSIFLGGTLFAEKRAILLRDVGENKEICDKIADFLETPHRVVIFETKLDKRSNFYKALKDKAEFREFNLQVPMDVKLVFSVFETALVDGKKAVLMVEKIENTQDPYMFFGLMVSQALKRFEERGGIKEKRVLKELSKLDMQMKSTTFQPWLLVKTFLLRVSQL